MNDVTEQLQSMQRQIESLQIEVRLLKSFGRMPKSKIVGAAYVAHLFGISEQSVIRKRFGTGSLRRVRQKPVGFVKAEVDALHAELFEKNKTERAIEAEDSANTRKNRK